MTIEKQLPSVATHPRGSVSVQRALKHAIATLNKYAPDGEQPDDVTVAIDDLTTLLECTHNN
jgi:hypothetical protein